MCGDKDYTWKKFYNEYLQLYKDNNSWNDNKNKVSCIIGFFCYLYEKHYKTKYTFIPKNPNPYSCRECKLTWELLSAFNNNAVDVKNYLSWVFNKSLKNSTQVFSLAYMSSPTLIRKYNLSKANEFSQERQNALPEKFIEWCKTNTPGVFGKYSLRTYNDLFALYTYTKNFANENNMEKQIITQALKMGIALE